MDDPTRPGRPSQDERLVRPYVLGQAGEDDSGTQPGEAAPPAPPGGASERGGAGDPVSQRPGAETSGSHSGRASAHQSGWRAAWAAPWPPATRPLPSVQFSERRGPSHASGWRRRLAGRGWIAGLAAVAAVLALTGGVILLAARHPAGVLAGTCGGTQCHHATPGVSSDRPSPGPSPGHSHHAARPSATHTSVKSSPPAPSRTSRPATSSPTPGPSKTSRSPKPSTSPSPKPSPSSSSADVSVTYSSHSWHNRFTGEFTIVNKGKKAVDGWQLVAVLPGDTVQWVWPDQFKRSGSTLTIDPSGNDKKIAPGASLTEHISGQGPATTPTSCTFNGSPC
jgi:hypothetical protein